MQAPNPSFRVVAELTPEEEVESELLHMFYSHVYIVFQCPQLVEFSKDLPPQEQVALLVQFFPGASLFARYAVDDFRECNRAEVLKFLLPVTPETLTNMVPTNKEYIQLVQESIRNFVDAKVLVYN